MFAYFKMELSNRISSLRPRGAEEIYCYISCRWNRTRVLLASFQMEMNKGIANLLPDGAEQMYCYLSSRMVRNNPIDILLPDGVDIA